MSIQFGNSCKQKNMQNIMFIDQKLIDIPNILNCSIHNLSNLTEENKKELLKKIEQMKINRETQWKYEAILLNEEYRKQYLKYFLDVLKIYDFIDINNNIINYLNIFGLKKDFNLEELETAKKNIDLEIEKEQAKTNKDMTKEKRFIEIGYQLLNNPLRKKAYLEILENTNVLGEIIATIYSHPEKKKEIQFEELEIKEEPEREKEQTLQVMTMLNEQSQKKQKIYILDRQRKDLYNQKAKLEKQLIPNIHAIDLGIYEIETELNHLSNTNPKKEELRKNLSILLLIRKIVLNKEQKKLKTEVLYQRILKELDNIQVQLLTLDRDKKAEEKTEKITKII